MVLTGVAVVDTVLVVIAAPLVVAGIVVTVFLFAETQV